MSWRNSAPFDRSVTVGNPTYASSVWTYLPQQASKPRSFIRGVNMAMYLFSSVFMEQFGRRDSFHSHIERSLWVLRREKKSAVYLEAFPWLTSNSLSQNSHVMMERVWMDLRRFQWEWSLHALGDRTFTCSHRMVQLVRLEIWTCVCTICIYISCEEYLVDKNQREKGPGARSFWWTRRVVPP